MSSFYHDPTTACRRQSTSQEDDIAWNHESEALSMDSKRTFLCFFFFYRILSSLGVKFVLFAANKQQTLLENDIEKIEIPSENNKEPCEGMLFESEEAARTFYDDYATRVGFITRVLSSRKSERDGMVISRGLGCRGDSENHKNESIMIKKKNKSRDNCRAMILVKREKPGNWAVRKFIKEHNHPLGVSVSKRRSTFVSFHRLFF